ncbi:MAG: protein kinase [Muribaculaceae bacterium]|nr:protein kinase [Muribaculaceae bacterium]MBR5551002.1 protein kinase [Muribaculaceae bacterium]
MDNIKENVSEKWTEIELLPEWDEEFYDVYTAKKFGKWLMLKTLKPQYRGIEKYETMIEKEFDVRYNLAHAHIVMINDFEEVPGIGRCIITDDVYGTSLRKLIDEKRVTPHHIEQLRHQLVSAMDYIQSNHIVHHPIRPERIIFTENIENLKLIDVGFDQKEHLEPTDAAEDIYNYGLVLKEVLDSVDENYPNLRKIADRCTDSNPSRRYHDVQELHLALERRSGNYLYLLIISFLVLMVLFLTWMIISEPAKPEGISSISNAFISLEKYFVLCQS